LDSLWQFLTSTDFLLWVVWSGMALLTVGLLILMQTRWGRSRPLRKCVVLSLLAHLLFLSYAATVKIVTNGRGRHEDTKIQIAEDESHENSQDLQTRELAAWERPTPTEPNDTTAPVPPVKPDQPLERAQVDQVDSLPPAMTAGVVDDTSSLEAAPNLATSAPAQVLETAVPMDEDRGAPAASTATAAAAIEAPRARQQEAPQAPMPESQHLARAEGSGMEGPTIDATAPPEGPLRSRLSSEAGAVPQLAPAPQTTSPEVLADTEAGLTQMAVDPVAAKAVMDAVSSVVRVIAPSQRLLMPRADAARGVVPVAKSHAGELSQPQDSPPPPSEIQPRQLATHDVPEMYRLRVQPNREQLVAMRGGNAATQTAVRQALNWLAANQSPDGRWDASLHGAGQEHKVLGHDRDGAGANADTGITGLALLAFLGDGHTHRTGPYRHVVQAGLNFLIRSQRSNGDLSGDAEMYAAMYCHGMAAFALAEAYGMTGDPELRPAVERAISYTLSAQHPTQGGWRYRPGDAIGDTSQLGWQLMALKSAQLAGIEVPVAARNGMIRFLKSVSHGKHGGLASYRAGEQANRVMTAEALFCRQLLGMTRSNPASEEAGDYVLQELPGQGEQMNLYYWYYATLAMYQLQGKYWDAWNEALQATLLPRQETSGPNQGSWAPDNCIWGGYGGRVYSTAMATLCLEVYYRFLPIYAQKNQPLRR